MARFISSTAELSYLLEKIIDESSEFVILITPYLKIHSRLKKIIENRVGYDDILIGIVTRGLENNLELDWIDRFIPRSRIFIRNNLHAKCYINESRSIVTSLNLYDYSMINNIEYGFEINKTLDEGNYLNIFKTAKELINSEKFWSKRYKKYKCVELSTLAMQYKFVEINLVSGNNGKEGVRLINGHDTMLLEISPEIVLRNSGNDRLRELVDNYSLYEICSSSGVKYVFGEKVGD